MAAYVSNYDPARTLQFEIPKFYMIRKFLLFILSHTGPSSWVYCQGVMSVSEQKKVKRRNTVEDLRISPELRLCPKFDSVSIADFPVAPRGEMGVRVLDNCAEEHIM